MTKRKYKRHTIKDLKHFASENHNGKCLSMDYTRYDRKYLWKCQDKSHEPFEARWDNVKRGRWCKACSHKNLKIDFSIIQSKVKIFGGKLITKKHEYKNSKSPIIYLCENGHRCLKDWDRLRRAKIKENGQKLDWCSKCSRRKPYTIQEVQKMFKVRNGELLTKNYINNKQTLLGRCINKHEFEINVHNMLGGQWCKYCNTGFGESYTRFLLEQIFLCKFPSVYPSWLNGLELDGYNEKLKLAFEYQGIQHKEYTPHFHDKGKMEFKSQQKRDKLKRKKCEAQGVHLIEIDDATIDKSKLQKYLLQKIKKLGISAKYTGEIKIESFYKHFYSDKLKSLNKIVSKKGGRCLSHIYLGESTPLKFICKKRHEFEKKPSAIRKGIWCLHEDCYSKAPRAARAEAYIDERGGKMLSKYKNRNSPLTFLCEHGHENTTTWASLQKSWCSVCSKNKKGTIEGMREIAKSKDGICLSKEYLGSGTKLEWSCNNNNHPSWWATPSNIKPTKTKNGSWCPECDNERKRKGTNKT